MNEPCTTTLVLATSNPGKVREFGQLFKDLPISLIAVSELVDSDFSVNEDGETFEQNAIIKAKAIARETMLMTLADDSGLEVDALGGEPGVRSARFAGKGASTQQRNEALLKALEGVSEGDRTARFRCVMCLVDPWAVSDTLGDEVILTTGVCEGSIGFAPQGDGGFGYDPLFVLSGGKTTMAELSPGEKNQRSHRAIAALKMRDKIMERIAQRTEALFTQT